MKITRSEVNDHRALKASQALQVLASAEARKHVATRQWQDYVLEKARRDQLAFNQSRSLLPPSQCDCFSMGVHNCPEHGGR
jgi:hypothetical protein